MDDSEAIPPVFRRPRYQQSKRQQQGQQKKDKDESRREADQHHPRQAPPDPELENKIDITA